MRAHLPIGRDADDGGDEDDGVEKPVHGDDDRLRSHVHDILEKHNRSPSHQMEMGTNSF